MTATLFATPIRPARATAQVVLDRDLVVRAANTEYCTLTGRAGEEIVSVPLFEAFPGNPDDPHDGAERLIRSFEHAMTTASPHHLAIVRYDLEDPKAPGTFVRRMWMPVSRPVFERDRVVGVAVETREVTGLDPAVVTALERYRDATDAAPGISDEDDLLVALTSALEQVRALSDEVGNLRRAMASRSTIDQARGLVMAAQGCGPDEAFEALRRMSNDANVKLADVAAALVHRASAGGTDVAGGRATTKRRRRPR